MLLCIWGCQGVREKWCRQLTCVFSPRKGQLSLSKRAVKAKPSFKIHSLGMVQESTCFKASQGRADVTVFFFWYQKSPLVPTSAARTQGHQRMDRTHTSNCIQLRFALGIEFFSLLFDLTYIWASIFLWWTSPYIPISHPPWTART